MAQGLLEVLEGEEELKIDPTEGSESIVAASRISTLK
jgi:hypothetical protein